MADLCRRSFFSRKDNNTLNVMCEFFPSCWGMLRRSRFVQIFLEANPFWSSTRGVGTTSLHGRRQWFCNNKTSLVPLYPVSSIDAHNCAIRRKYHSNLLQFHSNQAACNKMITVVQVLLRLQTICIALQLLLLLLPLQLLHASPCPTTIGEFSVATTSDAEELSEALLCDGPGNFVVSWHGNVILSDTLSVSNGSTLNVTGSSDSADDGDPSAVIFSDGTVVLIEVDLGSTVSLTGLTFSGGDGAVRVNGESFVEVTDCSFVDNNRTSSNLGGGLTVRLSLE